MNFECLLLNAKAGNEDAITVILQMYRKRKNSRRLVRVKCLCQTIRV